MRRSRRDREGWKTGYGDRGLPMPPSTSSYTIWSLVVGVIGLVFLAFGGVAVLIGLILGAVAALLGGIALRDVAMGGSGTRGSGLALIGILIGGFLIVSNAYKFTATGCAPLKTYKSMYEKAGETTP